MDEEVLLACKSLRLAARRHKQLEAAHRRAARELMEQLRLIEKQLALEGIKFDYSQLGVAQDGRGQGGHSHDTATLIRPFHRC